MIKKHGDKFVVTNKSGTKVLGTHSSKKKAAKQLAAIEISKAKHMHEDTKRFKDFRKTLSESEYSEVLTGYGNRSAHTDGAGLHHLNSAGALAGINAMLATISRGTYLNPNEAFVKMRVRLNVAQLDFDWKPGSWDGGVGSYDIPVRQFGRVDGYDAFTGQIRFDGKANPTGGYTELNLHVDVDLNPDSLYVVTAKLVPIAPVVAEEGVEHDGDSLDEMAQTAGRFKEMGKKISATERDLERAIGTKRIGGTTTRLLKLYDKDAAEARSEKLYGRGGKVLKRKPNPNKGDVQEMAQTAAREREMRRKIEKHEDAASRGYSAKMTMSGKAGERGRKQEARHDRASQRLIKQDRKEFESPYLYGRGGKIVTSKGKKKKDPDFMKKVKVKEEVEPIEEMHKAGDSVKVPHKGKMVKGKIVRHDSGGSGKAQQHGGGYVVDVGEYGSITVPHHKIVKEELVGGQKKLDVNKNKKLDAQDFAMLRAKKKPVKEETVAEAKKFKAWTPRLDKLMKNRDAVRVTPKKNPNK